MLLLAEAEAAVAVNLQTVPVVVAVEVVQAVFLLELWLLIQMLLME
jgi:hypothetical protein